MRYIENPMYTAGKALWRKALWTTSARNMHLGIFPCSNVPAPILSILAGSVAEHARTLSLRIESSCHTVDDAAGALASLKHIDTVSVCGAPTPTLRAAVREGVLPKLDTVIVENMGAADKTVLADALRERGSVLRRMVLRGVQTGDKASQENVQLQAVVTEFVDERGA